MTSIAALKPDAKDAPPPPPPKPEPERTKHYQARPADLAHEQKQRNSFCLTVPRNVDPESLLQSDYFSRVAHQLNPRDVIHAFDDGGGWCAEFLVQESGPGFARVALLRSHRLPSVAPQASSVPRGYTVLFAGPSDLWCVRRGNSLLKSGFESEAAALQWLAKVGS